MFVVWTFGYATRTSRKRMKAKAILTIPNPKVKKRPIFCLKSSLSVWSTRKGIMKTWLPLAWHEEGRIRRDGCGKMYNLLDKSVEKWSAQVKFHSIFCRISLHPFSFANLWGAHWCSVWNNKGRYSFTYQCWLSGRQIKNSKSIEATKHNAQ